MSRKKRQDRLKKTAEEPDWRGIRFVSVGVGGKSWFEHDGYRYCTPGEMILARLLQRQGIPFTPDIRFTMRNDDSTAKMSEVIYVPDFVFDRTAWTWTEDDGTSYTIHGLEVKAHKPTSGSRMRGLPADAAKRMLKKQALLYRERHVVVIIVSEAEVEAWEAEGGLPMEPFDSGS